MGSATAIAVALLALQVITPLLAPRAAADDFLSPLLSPILNATCEHVECGKGTCQVSLNHTIGFVCDCQPGWRQLHFDDYLRFLPCVIPNCSLNYACSNESVPPAPPPSPAPPSNIFDPCMWSFCGGGSCVKTSTFSHRCDCKESYSNLLNLTSLPCFRECSIGADCTKLGFSLSNTSTSSSSPNASVNSNSSSRGYSARKNSVWLFFLAISLAMVQAT